jgi:hypothetical protein
MSPNTFLMRFLAPVLLIVGRALVAIAFPACKSSRFFASQRNFQPGAAEKGGDSPFACHAKKCGPGLSDPHCQHFLTRRFPPNPAGFAR